MTTTLLKDRYSAAVPGNLGDVPGSGSGVKGDGEEKKGEILENAALFRERIPGE